MIILFWALVVVLTAIDAVTKFIAVQNISEGEIIRVITLGDTDILSFSMHHNTGAAFSSFLGQTGMLMLVTVAAMGAMTVFFHLEKHKHPLMTVSLAMVVGGGAGNLIDRARLSYVVDFIRLWPFDFIFNFADICVVIGAILLAVYYLFMDDKYKKQFLAAESSQPEGESADER
ncbi:MAG: signal peptidase II [Huintestinicola sp.]